MSDCSNFYATFRRNVMHAECWNETKDVQGIGEVSHSITTLDECKTACISSDMCVAIDWAPSNAPESCWILDFVYGFPAIEQGIYTHYQLDRNCLS